MKITNFRAGLIVFIVGFVGFGSAFMVLDHEQKQIAAAKKIIECHDRKTLHDFIKTDSHFTDVDRATYLEKYPDDCYDNLGIRNPVPEDMRKLIDDPDKLDKARDAYAISRLGVIRK